MASPEAGTLAGTQLEEARTMPRETVEYHSRRKGSLGENEDWWRLIISEGGELAVEHEWSHTDAYKGRGSDSGSSQVSVAEFLADANADGQAKAKLRQVLNERGLAEG